MRRQRTVALFIGVSVVIHVALVSAGHMGLRHEPLPPQALTILEIETVTEGRAPNSPPPPTVPTVQPVPPPKKKVVKPRRAATPRKATRPAMVLGMRTAAGAPQDLDLDLSRDFERPEPVMAAPDGKGRLATSAKPPRDKLHQEPEARSVARNIRRMLSADQARRDLQDGRVSPHLYDLVRAAEGTFRPTWALTKGDRRGLGSVGNSMRSFASQLGKNYLSGIKEYMDPKSTRGALDDQQTPAMLEQYGRLRKAAEDGADKLTCTYCVELRPGETPRLTLARRSGKSAFDEQAKEALDRAVRHRPQAAGEAPVEACYLFTAKFFRVPPLPVVGCQFDEVNLTAECFYPFKKVLRSNVKLVGVRPLTDG
jgi:hypothetical protein